MDFDISTLSERERKMLQAMAKSEFNGDFDAAVRAVLEFVPPVPIEESSVFDEPKQSAEVIIRVN